LNESPGEPGIQTFVTVELALAVQIDFDLGCSRGTRPPYELPRKEVIQPQVPLRLPCYDFTPITTQTLGASLPCGLGQRLLVQAAFVV
jgi:hypothetical protein